MPSESLSEPARAAWDAVLARDPGATRQALAVLDKSDRRALTGRLQTWSKSLRDEGNDAWEAAQSASAYTIWADATWGVACAVAVGCHPEAAGAAEVLRRARRNLRFVNRLPARLMLDVAADHGVTWLPDLTGRLIPGSGLGEGATGLWRDIDLLLTAAGAPAPTDDSFTAGWLAVLNEDCRQQSAGAQADWLEASRYLPDLLPRVFDVEGLWCPEGLAPLATRSPQYRATVLDGCLRRIMNGATLPRLGTFASVWQALAVTPEEVLARLPVYTAIVATGAPGVATTAHQALAALDDEGRLPVDDLLDLAQVTLPRPQQPLVRAHLKLLRRATERHPARLIELTAAVELATQHSKPAVQALAATILQNLGRSAGTETTRLEELAEATHVVIGQEAVEQRQARAVSFSIAATPVPVPVPVPVRTEILSDPGLDPLPARPRTTADLVQDLMALREASQLEVWPPPTELNVFLDGLAQLQARDPAGLSEALAARLRNGFVADGLTRHATGPLLHLVLTAAMTEADRSGVPPHPVENYLRRAIPAIGTLIEQIMDGKSLYPGWIRTVGVSGLRLVELGRRLPDAPAPELLASPTDRLGRIDPAVLLARIETASSIWPVDLDAALLRTTREVPADLSDRAGALTSPAGQRLHQWWSDFRPAELGGLIGLLLQPQATASDSPEAKGSAGLAGAEWFSSLPHHPQAAAAWSVSPLPENWPWRGCFDTTAGAGSGSDDEATAAELLSWMLWPLKNPYSNWADEPEAQYRLANLLHTEPVDPALLGQVLGRQIGRRQAPLHLLLPVLVAVAGRRPASIWPLLVNALPGVLGSGVTTAYRFVEITEDVAGHLGRADEILGLPAAATGRSKLASAARSLESSLAGRRSTSAAAGASGLLVAP